ncbi:MAG TPA: SDR family NAD(P)-dependent oxidoreductase [Ilumatobacteraceae bacterium]|nr:SDR family NAD(P)-dependent oxidoreductase [Ilumatobacteraceae bacterium]
MNNAVHQPQTVLVLGGGSEIAGAIVAALASPALRHVVLAVRDPERVDTAGIAAGGAEVVVLPFDATDHTGHAGFLAGVVERVGDLDVVIQAFGQLGAPGLDDPVAAAELAEVNFVGAVSSGLAVAARLREQGHGVLVVLSSVAGVRTRPSNFVYGSTKAGQDAFATGLGHALHGTGARVLTVRPGFVRSAMTAGLPEAPFSVDPSDVADAVVTGLRRQRSVVWVPGVLQILFGVLRYAPGFVWRRLDR